MTASGCPVAERFADTSSAFDDTCGGATAAVVAAGLGPPSWIELGSTTSEPGVGPLGIWS